MVSTAPNRIRCPEMKFALNHRSRFLHGHDCCETGKAFPQVRQEKYFRPDARTAQAAVVRALPRFASDFHLFIQKAIQPLHQKPAEQEH